MAITASDVQTFAPEFAGVSTSIINLWIGWAPGAVDPDLFSTDADQAQMLWICHNLVRSAGGASGAGGAVTNRDVGDVSISNAAPPHMDRHMLQSTAYGQALYVLINRYCAGGAIV
jgi:hypothetical protein